MGDADYEDPSDGDLGSQVVQRYRLEMSIDPEWSESTERGFRWWGFRLAQTITSSEPWFEEQAGYYCTRVRADTDLVVDPGEGSDGEARLNGWLDYASLSGVTRPTGGGPLRLSCSMLIHDNNRDWAEPLFCLAATIQVGTAEAALRSFHERLHLEAAASAHPAAGRRSTPDEMISFVPNLVLPMGSEPSRFCDEDELGQTLEWLKSLHLPAGWSPEDGSLWCAVGFGTSPLAGGEQEVPTLIRFMPQTPHPFLGAGLYVTTLLPPEAFERRPEMTPIVLNSLEAVENNHPHCLGSWRFEQGPTAEQRTLAYSTFVPNLLFRGGLMRELATSACARAVWASRLFTGRP